MAKITFITQYDETITAEGQEGSLMELAVAYDVKGIAADCGGVCSCATCHVHVDSAFLDKLPEASEIEKDLLEFDDNYTENSRLACQITIQEGLDGVILTVVNK